MKALYFIFLFNCFFSVSFGQVTLTAEVIPYFSQTTGTAYFVYCSLAGPNQETCSSAGFGSTPPAQTRWGRSAGSVSGLGFTPAVGSNVQFTTPSSSLDFYLGSLTHFNFPIQNAANGTRLNLQLILRSGTTVVANPSFSYRFLIDETTNEEPCPYSSVTPCSDKITFVNGGFDFTQSFVYNNANYTLQLLGFKETQQSGSTPRTEFISQESQQSVGFLFGKITLACPPICQGGGGYILLPNGECGCNCATAAPCPYPAQVYRPDCSCACPSSATCVNGGTLLPDCSCNCPACPFPQQSLSNCACVCEDICSGCGVLQNNVTCQCGCSRCPACTLPNFIYDRECDCVCRYDDASCAAINPKYVEDPGQACRCVCSAAARAACTGNFLMDENTCDCYCPANLCPNGQQRFEHNCTCGDCPEGGNWVKNTTTGLCTVCPDRNCGPGSRLDLESCTCICDQLNCDRCGLGEVRDENATCACRACRAGECCCGNGRLEPGEECEPRFNGDPCCVNCRFTLNSCDDGDLCTLDDVCNGTGFCIGRPKCPINTDCSSYTCISANGTCVQAKQPNGARCGPDREGFPGEKDLCKYRCGDGVCQSEAVLCTDPDPENDCLIPVCNPVDGLCNLNVERPTGEPCNDEDPCTINDQCTPGGLCNGTLKICPASNNTCAVLVCRAGECVARPILGNLPCDDANPCTIGDKCSDNGVCMPGEPVRCDGQTTCSAFECSLVDGRCYQIYKNDSCNDDNFCTENDKCILGECKGEVTNQTLTLQECGAPPPPSPPGTDTTAAIIIIALAGAAALIGAIIGAALLLKKIRKSRLTDPDTWNPDVFSSVGANPLYKGAITTQDNALYEGAK